MTVYLVTILIVLIFMPLVFNLYIYFDGENKRLNFGVYLFNIIKVIGGFFECRQTDFFMHYSNKRAKLFNHKDMGKVKIKLKDFFAIEYYKIVGLYCFPCAPEFIGLSNGLFTTSNLVFPWINSKKDFLKLKTNLYVGSTNYVKIYYHIQLGFNLFTVITLIIKILVRNEKK